jgi:hypothetical protein
MFGKESEKVAASVPVQPNREPPPHSTANRQWQFLAPNQRLWVPNASLRNSNQYLNSDFAAAENRKFTQMIRFVTCPGTGSPFESTNSF